jgi:hypothetical protein
MTMCKEGSNYTALHFTFKDGLRPRAGIITPPSSPSNPSRSGGLLSRPGSSTLQATAMGALYSSSPALGADTESLRAGFRMIMCQKYRSMLGAWRVLDPLGQGRLSFFDFCKACKNLGGLCNARALWEAIDTNKDGFVSLGEIDPELGELLEGFASKLIERCGSAREAWDKHFNRGGPRGRCCFELFTQVAAKLGYTGDATVVFEQLNVDHCPSGISFKDFQLLDKWFKIAPKGRWTYDVLRPSRTTPDLSVMM